MITFNYKVTSDEFPGVIEEDSITFVSNFDQSPPAIGKELAKSFMHNYIYDWEDDTEPEDLFDIRVRRYGNQFHVQFWGRLTLTLAPDHTVIVELAEKQNFQSRQGP